MKKLLVATSACMLAAGLLGTAALAEWSEPEVVGDPEPHYGDHGGLPGGDNAGGESGRGWDYEAVGEVEYTEWEGTKEDGETRTGEQAYEAVNPGGQTVGTDRFDKTETWTEQRVWTEPEPPAGPPIVPPAGPPIVPPAGPPRP